MESILLEDDQSLITHLTTGDMIQFLNETLILFGDRKEEILNNKRVKATGGRTCCDNALGIEKENSAA